MACVCVCTDVKPFKGTRRDNVNWEALLLEVKDTVDATVGEVSWLKPGSNAAQKHLAHFLKDRLKVRCCASKAPNAPPLRKQSTCTSLVWQKYHPVGYLIETADH